ncbi:MULTISPECIES: hypothetical protein [Micrococcaceae]|uniref:hypothetical protein n=1 Tax=unclassified Kocuria TaxID=2649579 RepID=UPI0010117AD8|nr:MULTISPECIES: hypothetical protein [unclassified Kocuria]
MSQIALLIMIISALLGAFTCFRVPALSIRARRIWTIANVLFLATAALLATGGAIQGYSARSEPLVAVLSVVFGTAAAAMTGSPVTAAVLQLSLRSGRIYRSGKRDTDAAEQNIEDPERDSSLHGGLWIGVLERAGVAVTLLMGWPTGLTVLAAIKALGRFTELKKPDAVERFILGTFASFLWAAAWAGVAMLLVRGV